ncbi:oxidoreductase [Croceicoccus estronivorus]|uniref:SDR family NAD(P)-dependent oxidoreductase n=1 Tax=Croceicoccus estronivorus TaxID=1172626 RepID=UPI00082D62C9|nr:SDR family oxidoreductase [Croceicoccus estronivorus]OCC24699.1 oxidoreductase [Croceicoccus estronivorus]
MLGERLAGKAIIVVGSGTGIGAATSRRLAEEGAKVCLADINLPAAENVAEEIRSKGGEAFATLVDLADEALVKSAFDKAAEQFGKLDGAHINGADMATLVKDTDILDEPMAVFDRTMQVNLRGHVLCTRAVLPYLIANGGGGLVYTSSGAAHAGEPVRPAYAIAKSGLMALMRHVASAWGKSGVTANCVAPGLTITESMKERNGTKSDFQVAMLEKTPSVRLGRPEDIAGVVAMLLSEDGRWINGQSYNVDGGVIMI